MSSCEVLLQSMNIRPALTTSLLLALCAVVSGDEVTLTNGRTMRGEVLSKPGADPLVLETPAGKVKLPRRMIKEVTRDARPPRRPKVRKPPEDVPEELPRSAGERRASLKRVNPLPPKPNLPHARQLESLLAKGDPRSLTLAGIVYEDGRGVPYDHQRALALYRKAAKAGDGLAMSRLAFAYVQGEGVDTDLEQAKEWALAAAEAKDPFGLALVAAWGWGISNYSRAEAAERHLKAAQSGDLRGYYYVAKYKGIGKGFPRNKADSARWHERGAELGDPGCMDQHAWNLAYGAGIKRDRVAARRWARLAWSHGDAFGAVKWAQALREGWGADPDPVRALEILEATLKGTKTSASGAALFQLGQAHRNGWGTPVDFKRARRYLLAAFELRYDEAIPALAYMLFKGQGGEKDIASARKLWELGAEMDNAWSIRNLAFRAREGAWGPKDPAKARELFLRAANLGDSRSMYELGCMVFHGQGGPANHAEAVKWLEKGEARGNAAAAREVGRCYTQGWLGTKDLARARRAYQVSAEGGDLDGAASYAWMLLYGRGGPTSPKAGKKLLERGAAKKHAQSTYLLGRLLCDGAEGIPRDLPRAKRLMKQAASLGSKVAVSELRARGW